MSDAQRHNIPVYSVGIHRSDYRCTVEKQGIRLGFNYVNGFGEETANCILAARDRHPFASFEDFYRRVVLPQQKMEALIAAGAMDVWAKSRRDLFLSLGRQLERDMLALHSQSEPVQLSTLTEAEKVRMEYQATGISTGPHPMSFYRNRLKQRGILNSVQLAHHPSGQQVWVAGLMVVHQSPPTAKGFHFITLEDEYGFMNLIVRPKIYVQFRRVIRSTSLLLVKGQVQREGAVTNLILEQCALLDQRN